MSSGSLCVTRFLTTLIYILWLVLLSFNSLFMKSMHNKSFTAFSFKYTLLHHKLHLNFVTALQFSTYRVIDNSSLQKHKQKYVFTFSFPNRTCSQVYCYVI